MKYPYLASDLDGTIVSNKTLKIPASTIEDIIDYQKKSKGKFIIATGRNFIMIKNFAKQLKVTMPIIALNGMLIINPKNNEILFCEEIKKSVLTKIIFYAKKNELDFVVHTPNNIIGFDWSERIKSYKQDFDLDQDSIDSIVSFLNYQEMEDFILDLNNKIIKFTFSYDLTEIKKGKLNQEYFASLNLYCPDLIFNDKYLFDLMPMGINKATGIRKLSEILKINTNDIIAVGDNNNDVEMVAEFNGLAVGNACENLKKVAIKILEPVENNGVGKFLREI